MSTHKGACKRFVVVTIVDADGIPVISYKIPVAIFIGSFGKVDVVQQPVIARQ